MQPPIHISSETPPVDRGYAISMVIATFRGHANVEVHLFRPYWDEEEYHSYAWEELIGGAVTDDHPSRAEDAKKVILETFSADESQRLMDYLVERYGDRLSEIRCNVLEFPVPLDLVPLSSAQKTESVGKLDLNRIPNYPLDFPVRGIYDLSRHPEQQNY